MTGSAAPTTLGFIGGTGPEGRGLALRFGRAGFRIAIGSRSAERAQETAAAIDQQLGGELAAGYDNAGAVRASQVIFLTVPYAAQADTLQALAADIGDRVLVNVVAPLVFEAGKPQALRAPGGSAAQESQALLPRARVTAAFHHLSARHLADLTHPLEGDVLVCGDDAAAKQLTLKLVARLPDLRPVDAGGLEYAWQLESLTALLLAINRRYKTQTGIHLTGLSL